jgi:hypothetical protein
MLQTIRYLSLFISLGRLPFVVCNFDLRTIPNTSDTNVQHCIQDVPLEKTRQRCINSVIKTADKCGKNTNCTIVVQCTIKGHLQIWPAYLRLDIYYRWR